MLDLESLALKLSTHGDAEMMTALQRIEHQTESVHHTFEHLAGFLLTVEFWEHTIEATVELGAELTKLSLKTGETVENLSRLHFAAEANAVAASSFDLGMRRLTAAMQGDAMEAGNAAKAL